MNENTLRAILQAGEQYQQRLLKDYSIDVLLSDSWEALKFFFGRAFYQGRRDSLSERVNKTSVDILEQEYRRLGGVFDDAAVASMQTALQSKIGRGMVGKAGDVQMVIGTLRYIRDLPQQNIVSYSVQRIKDNQIRAHYYELQKSQSAGGIYQVGTKVASFYLRDLVCVSGLLHHVTQDEEDYVQPIDVWVQTVAVKTGLVTSTEKGEQTRQAIIKYCNENGCSSLQFNQGAWYLGSHAFSFLLEHLETCNCYADHGTSSSA